MKIFNTLTRKKEEFVPLEEGKVKMYVCGPTVYNLIHIGNARPMIIFDTFRRYLEYKGYDVNYVSNFTDVDDKIIKKAIEEGIILGGFLGISPMLCAALGYAAVFGSATNTLMAPIMLGIEVFGGNNMLAFVVVCSLAYVVNGNRSIYGAQENIDKIISR